MDLSYWEIKSWFSDIDYAIIGSGIVGLSTALRLRELHPNSKIIILEKGILPHGASTKNAGFACFGSLSEIIDDLKNHSEQEVFNLVKKRWKGLQLLRQNLGDNAIDLKQFGGFEIYTNDEEFDSCYAQYNAINTLIKPIFNDKVFEFVNNSFGFKNINNQYAFNKFEAQIDTGKMMQVLLKKAIEENILIVNSAEVTNIEDAVKPTIQLNNNFDFKAKTVLISTNGFAKSLIDEPVDPARAQVIITKPIKNLHIKGIFHLNKGYYYFRNIDNRILFGGGRQLDFDTEKTTEFGKTIVVQNALESILKTVILPNTNFEIEHRWSGIMGVGNQKKTIIKQLSNTIFCAVRLGGMGVAIGSLVGKELAEKVK
jgi:glycine/D-amino acid oxidase-like deaminating enzyme